MYSNVGANLARYVQMSEQMENNDLERQLKQMQIDNMVKENEAWDMMGNIFGEGPGEKTVDVQNPNYVDPASMPGYEAGDYTENRPLTGDYYKQNIQQTRKETRPEMYQRAIDTMMKKSPRAALSVAKSFSDMEKKDTDVQIVTNPVDGSISLIDKRTRQVQHLTDGIPKTELAAFISKYGKDRGVQEYIQYKKNLKQTPTINIRQGGGGGSGQPKIGSIWERIQIKVANGEQLTPGEQKIYELKTKAPQFDLQIRRQARANVMKDIDSVGLSAEELAKREDEEYVRLLGSGSNKMPVGQKSGGKKPLNSFFK